MHLIPNNDTRAPASPLLSSPNQSILPTHHQKNLIGFHSSPVNFHGVLSAIMETLCSVSTPWMRRPASQLARPAPKSWLATVGLTPNDYPHPDTIYPHGGGIQLSQLFHYQLLELLSVRSIWIRCGKSLNCGQLRGGVYDLLVKRVNVENSKRRKITVFSAF